MELAAAHGVRLDVGLGLGKWVYTDDATGTYRDGGDDVTYTYALKDLRSEIGLNRTSYWVLQLLQQRS